MLIHKAFRYKLLPSEAIDQQFSQWAGSCRYISNLALEQKRLNWNQFEVSHSYASQCKELTLLKQEKEVEWLNDVPSQCLQQSLKDLDQAFKNFFEGRAQYPQFKKKGENDSFRFPSPNQFSISNRGKKGLLDLPKVGLVKFVCSRKKAYEGRVLSLTISREVDQWYVSIQCEVEIPEVEVIPEEDLGLDWGVIHTLTGSNHQHMDLDIDRLKQIEHRIELVQKKLSQQKKFGSNWRKTQKHLAKLYRKIRRIKEDFIHKTTTKLVRSYGGIAVEDLKIKNMTASAAGTVEEPGQNVAQKSGLNRSILRTSPSRTFDVLEYKCEWNRRLFVPVAPFRSSQECSNCGYTDARNRKNQAEFWCQQCNYQENADINAAKTIKKRA